jgi:hypothetical protein
MKHVALDTGRAAPAQADAYVTAITLLACRL